MLITYAMEDRSPWYVLAFAVACVMGSVYGFLQGAWPFGLVEAVWSIVALNRWRVVYHGFPTRAQNVGRDSSRRIAQRGGINPALHEPGPSEGALTTLQCGTAAPRYDDE